MFNINKRPQDQVDRVLDLMKKNKWSQAKLAEIANVTPQAINQWFREKDRNGKPRENRTLSAMALKLIAEEAQVDLDWLISGEGTQYIPHFREKGTNGVHFVAPYSLLTIDRENNGELSSSEIPDESEGVFTLGLYGNLLNQLKINGNSLCRVTVYSNSMEPIIQDGDCLIVDTSNKRIVDNCIYVFSNKDHVKQGEIEEVFARYVRKNLSGDVFLYTPKGQEDKFTQESLNNRYKTVGKVIGKISLFTK